MKLIIREKITSYNKEIRYHPGLGAQVNLLNAIFRVILSVTFAVFVMRTQLGLSAQRCWWTIPLQQ